MTFAAKTIFCSADAQELKLLQEDSKVYKLIGPALVEQQLPDALKNVSERISFIDSKL